MANITSPYEIAASLTEFWSPRIVAEVDDAYIKVAKVQGTLAWHQHEDEDELFFILNGHLRIELETGDSVELAEGQRSRHPAHKNSARAVEGLFSRRCKAYSRKGWRIFHGRPTGFVVNIPTA
jgi:hypothetical protein